MVKSSKPSKPYKGFPLYAHATKRWAKKIKGRLHYFGPWCDPDGALARFLDEKDDLYAGRVPRSKAEGLTVLYLCDGFKNHMSQHDTVVSHQWLEQFQNGAEADSESIVMPEAECPFCGARELRQACDPPIR